MSLAFGRSRCDRILWRAPSDDPKAGPGADGPSQSRVSSAWYGRHELTCSDHRPVCAALMVAVAVAVAERRRAVQREILRSLDAWENECMPMAQLHTHELTYGAVCPAVYPPSPPPAIHRPCPAIYPPPRPIIERLSTDY